LPTHKEIPRRDGFSVKTSNKQNSRFARVWNAAPVTSFIFALVVVCLLAAPQVRAQSICSNAIPPAAANAASSSRLAFEVASIKPSEDIQAQMAGGKMPHIGIKVDNSQVDIGYFNLAQLISCAYNVDVLQVSGPDWIKTERFDVLAKLPDGATKDQVAAMLQSLLADRFKMVMHRETKDLSAFVLEVGKGGIKFQPSPPDQADAIPDTDKDATTIDTGNGQMRVKTTGNPENGGTTTMSGGPAGNVKVSVANGMMHMESSKMTMALFCQQLTRFLNTTVVDKTGLTGSYVVAVDISMQDLMQVARANGINMGAAAAGGSAAAGGPGAAGATPEASDPAGGSIYSSIEKLGLKLQKEKTPMDVIVVDSIEKMPTAN
jgi:uncharacterized protein (TIGR03435 family)